MGNNIGKGVINLSSSFNLSPVSRKKIRDYFYKEVKSTDKYGMVHYTYIPSGKGLDEKGLKLQLIDAYETSSAEIWRKKMEFASIPMTTDRYFERVPISYGTQAPLKFTGDRVYHNIRLNSADVIAVEYSDGYTWKLRDEMELAIKNVIEQTVVKHLADYASIPARQFSYLLQATGDSNYYPEAVVTSFDDKALIDNTAGRLMSTANEDSIAGAGNFHGNVLTGTMSTTKSITTLAADIDNVLTAFSLMEHPEQEGDKFWENAEDPRMKLIFYVPPTLVRLFNKLINAEMLPVSNQFVNNEYFKDGRIIVKTLPHFNGSTSDLSYFVQLYDPAEPSRKPHIEVRAESLEVPEVETWGWDTGNKEMSDTLSKAVGYYDFVGYGAGIPQTIIKVSNT